MKEIKQKGKLTIHSSKETIHETLHSLIHESFQRAINSSGTFYIALSGGSLPSFLTTLPQSFVDANIDPQWDRWHIVLADERLVPSNHVDSNLSAVRKSFLDATSVQIPKEQIYDINEQLFGDGGGDDNDDNDTMNDIDLVASDYQSKVFDGRLKHRDSTTVDTGYYLIDCALLGFGPDGHTCSLFPNHPLSLQQDQNNMLVAGISDSPKLPPKRITLTFKALNEFTRDVIFVGAGGSKSDVLRSIFHRVSKNRVDNDREHIIEKSISYNVQLNENNVYPCGMIRPKSNSLHYITDKEATTWINRNQRFTSAML